jgi:hypothetical protein
MAAAGAALAACGGTAPTTLDVRPAAATGTAAAQAQPAGAQAAACDAGRWTGSISPEGRPDGLDAGDAGAVYVWHDGDGWHVRATDRRPTDHHYTGTIRLSGGGFADVRPVRDEQDDRVTVGGDDLLHYDLHTYASVDGVDFRVTCPPERHGRVERQRIGFHTEFDGHPVSDRVRIGDSKRSPAGADFAFVRTA